MKNRLASTSRIIGVGSPPPDDTMHSLLIHFVRLFGHGWDKSQPHRPSLHSVSPGQGWSVSQPGLHMLFSHSCPFGQVRPSIPHRARQVVPSHLSLDGQSLVFEQLLIFFVCGCFYCTRNKKIYKRAQKPLKAPPENNRTM